MWIYARFRVIVEIIANEEKKKKKTNKQICEILLPSPSQDRDAEVSGLYTITVKQLHKRVGNPCIDTLAHRATQLDTETHAHTDN